MMLIILELSFNNVTDAYMQNDICLQNNFADFGMFPPENSSKLLPLLVASTKRIQVGKKRCWYPVSTQINNTHAWICQIPHMPFGSSLTRYC